MQVVEFSVLSGRLSHLYMTVFLHDFAIFMVSPVITDVTVSALCPGGDGCSLAIYLTGFQNVIAGLGTLVVLPVIGNLSDRYGRKALITLPITLTIIPLAILAYSRKRSFFYAYYVLNALVSMFCQGTVHCLSLAYVADTVPIGRRASAFGILSGVGSAALVCGNLSTRFLSVSSTFQVAAGVAVAAAVYMGVFLPDSVADADDDLSTPFIAEGKPDGEESAGKNRIFISKALLPVLYFLSSLRINSVFSQVAIVAFLSHLADVGLRGPLQYFLKAKFGFNKTQFADLMVVSRLAGAISQLIVMPILAPALGEERLLSAALLSAFAQTLVYSISWSSWVPYAAAMFSILYVLAKPCIQSVVSKQFGSSEQGKAQGIILGIGSLASVLSPLAFSPLTALFLSENAPFHFPGFSIMCAGFPSMIAFILSLMIRNSQDQNETVAAAAAARSDFARTTRIIPEESSLS